MQYQEPRQSENDTTYRNLAQAVALLEETLQRAESIFVKREYNE